MWLTLTMTKCLTPSHHTLIHPIQPPTLPPLSFAHCVRPTLPSSLTANNTPLNCIFSIKKTNSFLLFLLFSLTSPLFSLFFSLPSTKTLKSTEMTDKKDVKAQSVDELEVLVGQGYTDAKRELAIRLMEGNGVPQNHPKAVALLEDCVALGDAGAMPMLANCCALGHGMEHDAERAESLICEAANKGNEEALCLMELINDWKGQHSINLRGLSSARWTKIFRRNIFRFITVGFKGGRTIERVCLLMNIVPCKAINLSSQINKYEHMVQNQLQFYQFVEWHQQGTTLEKEEQHQ